MKKQKNIFRRIFSFYAEGFRTMTWGRELWVIIIIKLFIMFGILKVLFFPNFLNQKFSTEKEKGNYVIERLTNPLKEE